MATIYVGDGLSGSTPSDPSGPQNGNSMGGGFPALLSLLILAASYIFTGGRTPKPKLYAGIKTGPEGGAVHFKQKQPHVIVLHPPLLADGTIYGEIRGGI